MKELTKFIDIAVPVAICNLKCNYCYLSHCKDLKREDYEKLFLYSPEHVKQALTIERLGGVAILIFVELERQQFLLC